VEPEVSGSRNKLLLIGIAAAVVVAVIVGILLWNRNGTPVPNSNNQNTNTNRTPRPTPPPGMVYVEPPPDGTFTMGFNGSSEPSEKPEHPREVKAFFLDEKEVTLKEYYDFLQATGRRAPEKWPKEWKEGKFSAEEGTYPVTYVDWFDAKAYAERAGKRLPNEAEWEYAARGTDKRLYPWGAVDYQPGYANVGPGGKLMPVGSFPNGASPSGALDMAGNVAEWTSSDCIPYPGAEFDPEPGKIVRGGSFFTDKIFARTTTRAWLLPTDSRSYLGFRCAKDIP
jgi:serine/threonine-protein kinase